MLVNGETTSDGNAGGPSIFPGVAATDSGPNNGNVPIVELAVSNGTAGAVWEVVNTNPNTPESFKFAVYVTYTADVIHNSPAPGTATVHLSYAATAYSGTAGDSSIPLPRFVPDSSCGRLRVHHSGVHDLPVASALRRRTVAISHKVSKAQLTRW